MTQPNPGQPATGGQARVPMYRPEHMQSLPFLSKQDKEKYETGLRGLWHTMESNGPETEAHVQSKKKIQEFSAMVAHKINSVRRQQMQQQQQHQRQQQQQQQQQGQQQGTGAQSSQPQNAALAAQQRAAMAQRQAAIQNAAANGGGQAGAPGGGHQQQQQRGPHHIPEAIANHVNSMQVLAPPNIARDQQTRWIGEAKNRYGRALILMEQSSNMMKQIEAMVKDREQKGQPMSQEEIKKLRDTHVQKHADAKRYVEQFRKEQEILKHQQQQNATAGGQNTPQPRPQQPSNPNPMQAATAAVNTAVSMAKNQQLAAANGSQGMHQTPSSQGHAGPATTAAAVPPSMAPSSQPHSAPTPQAQVKIEPGTQPHPPTVNTGMAAAANVHVPSVGTPNPVVSRVHTPQNGTPVTGPAKPLSHSTAVNLANRQVSASSAPMGNGHQPGSVGTPGSAGGAMGQVPPGGHPHAHPQPAAQPINSKLPIPKQLPQAAMQIPQAVNPGGGVSNGRPTLTGGTGISGGTMAQPVVNKTPAYTFDADGEHVLSKKKLDELVRQVCGGGPPGQEGNYLTPDVEESILGVADNFVDNTLNAACRLAKARGSKVLEIRDIQMVLERNYNIRIPGYTSDELRTVRKAQPSQAWYSKMSAVQAAKVMPSSKDDK